MKYLKEAGAFTSIAYADIATTCATGEYTLVDTTDAAMQKAGYTAISDKMTFGQAIGDIFKNKIMSQTDYDRLYDMTDELINEYKETISENEWLDEDSKEAITAKLDNMNINILGPESGYIDYTGLELKSSEEGGTAVENYIILKKFMTEKINELTNTPSVAVSAWLVFSPTITNAFYDSSSNSINICPGYINDASYRSDMTDEEMYGAIGTTIAHEISHAFDYQGSQFDYLGKAEPVISSDNLEQYLSVQQKLTDYFDSIILYNDKLPTEKKRSRKPQPICQVWRSFSNWLKNKMILIMMFSIELMPMNMQRHVSCRRSENYDLVIDIILKELYKNVKGADCQSLFA